MLNTKNLSFVLLSVALLNSAANAATDLTPLFDVYEEACGHRGNPKAKTGVKNYNNFKNIFIGHKETVSNGEYNGTTFFLKKNYIIPVQYRKAVDSITMKKGDKYSSDSITYTVKFKDATYRRVPLSHLEVYLVPNSGHLYDALYFKTSIQGLKSNFKEKTSYSNEAEEYFTLGASFNYAKKAITCDWIPDSYM